MREIENQGRYVKAARCANAAIRWQGRVPGQEARAARWDCSTPERTPKALRQLTQLSATTASEKGPDGLTKQQREANQLILERAAVENQAHAERCQQEWAARQQRLHQPERTGRQTGIGLSMTLPY